jgi:hypothetical protein
VHFYNEYLVNNEAEPADLLGLPEDLKQYQGQCAIAAARIYQPDVSSIPP